MTFNEWIIDRITGVLRDKGDTLVDALKEELIRQDKKATGNLIDSIEFDVNGTTMTISMADYARWVDEGRSPNSKFPPVNAIRDWVRTKGLTLDNSSASLDTQQNQLSYLIGRKIARDGIPATNFIDKALKPSVLLELEVHIVQDIERNIDDWFLSDV